MTKAIDGTCRTVLMSAMAALDGEAGPMTTEQVDAHLDTCGQCRESVARMRAVHARLDCLNYDPAPIDLWPGIHAGIRQADAKPPAREGLAFALLIALCLAWRTGQLVFDLPAPVLNGLLPLAATILVLHWLAGDPLAIQLQTPELQQERM